MTTTEQGPHLGSKEFTGLDRGGILVFIGLMLGMFVASISQTIVGPAMPRIVAELGGMEHYSWIATAAMLVSAVTVPIVGKLSDMFGRKHFYLLGLVVFMIGSALAGTATNFWFLVTSRAIQGFGMGTLLPLSQTIIGDIIPPRQRGKYQGFMGATFGVSSIAGPLLGGWVTDAFGWRWLFYLALPVGIIATIFMWRFMRLEHRGTAGKIDILGVLTLTPGLILALLATTWGGTTYPWLSPTILGMFALAIVFLALFIAVELRAVNPLIPLHMLRDTTVSAAILASFAIAVAMFGAIIYIPVFAQGVLGVSATDSGLILIPLNLAMILTAVITGMVITRTGRYREILIGGGIVLVAGYAILSSLSHTSSPLMLALAMVVIGIGLGLSMQTYTLVVQNAVQSTELGVATASVQFFRNLGSTIGIAVLGSVMSAQMLPKISAQLPRGVAEQIEGSGSGGGAAAVLDPAQLEKLPAPIAEAIRAGMGDAMHLVFLTAVPFAVAALLISLFVQQRTLRTTN